VKQNLNWNDLRLFLAASRAGNLRAAARILAVDQSTLSRRIEVLEDAIKATLLVRTNRGISLTEAGATLREHVEKMEHTMGEIEQSIWGQAHAIDGTLKIASLDEFGAFWLTPRLKQFREQYPTIDISLTCADGEQQALGFSRAHVMLQLGRPSQESLIGRKLDEIQFGLYASHDYIERAGRPKNREELLNRHRFIVLNEINDLAESEVKACRAWEPWLTGCERESNVAFRTNSYAAQMKAAVAGFGISVMPTYMQDEMPDLSLIELEDWSKPSLPLTLLFHHTLKESPRVRSLIDFLSTALRRGRPASWAKGSSSSDRRISAHGAVAAFG